MSEKTSVSKKGFSADWLMSGALARIGDTFDRLTGRRWIPSSSLATSELIERIKKLLDAEAKQIPGKGTVVPHNIKLKIQWDKFSTDAEDALTNLEHELLTAAADHINDSLYYTYAPLQIKVKPDYFTEGVKLFVSFEKFADDEHEAEMNVTVPSINIRAALAEAAPTEAAAGETFMARFTVDDARKEKRLVFPADGRLSVGRTGGSDLMIDDPSVSKIHASLLAGADGSLSVADTGSTNGTFINDQRISYGKATRLVEDDRVKFGAVDVVFEHIPPPATVEQETVEDISVGETVEIDGFVFKGPVSPEPAGGADGAMPDGMPEAELPPPGRPAAPEAPKDPDPTPDDENKSGAEKGE